MAGWRSRCTGMTRDEAAPAPVRVFVFGCSRSGTTLLLNLLRAFRHTFVLDREHRLEEFERHRDDERHVVIKRSPLCAVDLEVQLPRWPDVWLLHIMRDPRDVVTSHYGGARRFHTEFSRWERDVEAGLHAEATHTRSLRVMFQDLVLRPRKVEQEIGSLTSMSIGMSFADVAPRLDDGQIGPKERLALNGVRELDVGSVARWRRSPENVDRVRQQVIRFPALPEALIRHGFEADDSWLDSITQERSAL